ncbi:import inner membrane translocase subunit tim44 [Tremella mesenterica]|uniref:Mitochondrial import inner membrane translocase subunit TIM44 n=1 Tax=Tremella mesenterica TaxID=5217 RepID=A0A4Q1BLS3_TREME|nr:import inner membrane translocase subunit tim44 [Tremella mesenterica]
MKSRPIILRALKARQASTNRIIAPPRPSIIPYRPLHSSSRQFNEHTSHSDPKSGGQSNPNQSQSNQSKSRSRQSEEVAGPPQSPFKVFIETLKQEIKANQGWQDNVKQLQGDVDKLADTQAMRRAKELYERARIMGMIKDNPRIQSALDDLKKRGVSASEAISRGLEDSGVISAIQSTYGWAADTTARLTQPFRDTPMYKALAANIEEAFDDTAGAGSRYGGYEEKEERRKRRELRAQKAGKIAKKRVKANAEAGEALVLASDSEPTSSRFSFLTSSPTFQRLKEAYYESDSPAVSALRYVTTTVGRWSEENETARVIRAMREIDPDFQLESWTRELREYIVPEVVDAYLSADRESLKAWCGEATYNVLWATMGQYIKQGLISDSKILDIKHVDVTEGKMLENGIPVFIITFATQELLLFRNAKTGDVVVGSENDVETCRYALVITRVETELENELTGGWKVVEVSASSF